MLLDTRRVDHAVDSEEPGDVRDKDNQEDDRESHKELEDGIGLLEDGAIVLNKAFGGRLLMG